MIIRLNLILNTNLHIMIRSRIVVKKWLWEIYFSVHYAYINFNNLQKV